MDYYVIKKDKWYSELTLRVLSMQLRALDVHECALAGQSMAEAIRHAVGSSEYLSAIMCTETMQPLAI